MTGCNGCWIPAGSKHPGIRPNGQPATIRGDLLAFLQAAVERLGLQVDPARQASAAVKRLDALLNLPSMAKRHDLPATRQIKPALKYSRQPAG